MLKSNLHNLLKQEDLKWRQRAKVEWLWNRDRNTNFFHACASQRNRRNHIRLIVDGNGRSCPQPGGNRTGFCELFLDRPHHL